MEVLYYEKSRTFFSYTDHLCGRSHVYRTDRPCLWKNNRHRSVQSAKTLTINNTTIYDLTDLHFICNNDSSSNEELSLVKAGSSETVELPRSSVYSIHVSGKAANGTSFSNTFSGTIDNSSSVTISLDDSANLSVIANIAD